jgi:cell wall-associated NlpC family hydrolase
MTDIASQRAAVVAEARTWLRTPYHHMGRVKGAGVDCLMLLAEVFERVGLVPHLEIEHYPPDWHLHREAERYLDGVLRHTVETAGPPLPGDVVLWRFGRCFSHGAIVVAWPAIIHAYVRTPCTLEDAERAAWLTHIGENGPEQGRERPRRFFTLKAWAR